jgi:hypothetical protein
VLLSSVVAFGVGAKQLAVEGDLDGVSGDGELHLPPATGAAHPILGAGEAVRLDRLGAALALSMASSSRNCR